MSHWYRRTLYSACVWALVVFALSINQRAEAQHARAQLERKKSESLRKINTTKRILYEVAQQKTVSLEQLALMEEQIKTHEQLIKTYSEELNILNGEISETGHVIGALTEDLKRLRAEYAQMIQWSYQNKNALNTLTFLFASESFRQLLLRMKYLSQYAQLRRLQLAEIEKVQKNLSALHKKLYGRRSRQERLYETQKRRRAQLLGLRRQKTQLVSELVKREKVLRRNVTQQQKALARLNALIKDLIENEKLTASASGLTEGDMMVITNAFARQRRGLRWPVQQGIIVGRFGRQKHAVLKGVEVDNPGVEIQTKRQENVRAVFEGIVATIAYVPGMNTVVILRHGDYYTLYARMARVLVKKEQRIAAGQIIGSVYTNAKGISGIQFQVWKQNTKLDPEKWLARR